MPFVISREGSTRAQLRLLDAEPERDAPATRERGSGRLASRHGSAAASRGGLGARAARCRSKASRRSSRKRQVSLVTMGKGALGQLAAYWPEDTLATRTCRSSGSARSRCTRRQQPPANDRHWSPQRVAASYAEISAAVKKLAAALRGRIAKGLARRDRARRSARAPLALSSPASRRRCSPYAAAGEIAPEEMLRSSAPTSWSGAKARRRSPSLRCSPRREATRRTPDFKKPLLAFAKPDRSGEVAAQAQDARRAGDRHRQLLHDGRRDSLWLRRAPADWLSLAMLLGAWQSGATVWAGWEERLHRPERVDYLVIDVGPAMREHRRLPATYPSPAGRRRRRRRH